MTMSSSPLPQGSGGGTPGHSFHAEGESHHPPPSSWLQAALNQQAQLLQERENEVRRLQERLREAMEQLSKNNSDPEGFLIERIIDEEEKCAALEKQLKESNALLAERDRSVSALQEETRWLREALKQTRLERRDDVVRAHAEWADAHMIHNLPSLSLEAVGVLLDDLQGRRAEILQVAHRLEDWNSKLRYHYCTAVADLQRRNAKQHTPSRVTATLSVHAAEARRMADCLMRKIRGECTQLTHNAIAALANGPLSRSHADSSTFAGAFNTIRGIIKSCVWSKESRGDHPSTDWLPGVFQPDNVLGRLDSAVRHKLVEATKEMVLCYDSSPRSIQSLHGSLLEELFGNESAITIALRLSTSAPPPGSPDHLIYPVSVSDLYHPIGNGWDIENNAGSTARGRQKATTTASKPSRRVNSSEPLSPRAVSPRGRPSRRPSSLGPRPYDRPSPRTGVNGHTPQSTARSAQARQGHHRAVSPFQRRATAPTILSALPTSTNLKWEGSSSSTTTSVYGPHSTSRPSPLDAKVLSHSSPPVKQVDPLPPPPFTTPPKRVPLDSAPLSNLRKGSPRRSPPPPSSPPREPVKRNTSPPQPQPQPTPAMVSMTDIPANPAKAEDSDPPPPARVEPPPKKPASPVAQLDMPADGFLTEQQRREIKELAMGSVGPRGMVYAGDDSDLDSAPPPPAMSREDMKRQLMSFSGALEKKLNRKKTRPFVDDDAEVWTEDEDMDLQVDRSPEEFDSPFHIDHPDYNDPLVTAGRSNLRQQSSCGGSRSVSFAPGT